MLTIGAVMRFPTAALLVAAAACSDVEILADRPYDDRFGESTTMDVYLPSGGGSARPAVLMIHGGGWHYFSKDAYIDAGTRLAGSGFVTASINYRLTPEGEYPRAMQDCACALAYLRAHAAELAIDPDRIAVLGYSAGGHLAAVLGVAIAEPDFQPDCAAGPTYAPAAVIAGAGPQDLRDLAHADAVQDLIGGTIDELPERYDRASPITHADVPGAPPFLLIHGTGDLFVPIEQSRRMRRALRDAGNDARLLEIRGGGHLLNLGADLGQSDLLTSADTPEAWAATIAFLDETLGAP